MTDAHELKRRDAERAHEILSNFISKMNEAAIETSHLALRTVIFINGAAAVAVLAFLGAIAAKEKIEMGQLGAVAGTIVWFATGVAAGMLALGFAYLTNYCNARAANTHNLSWDHPYVSPGPTTKRWERITLSFHLCGLVAAIAAMGLFVWGMLDVRAAITLLAPKG